MKKIFRLLLLITGVLLMSGCNLNFDSPSNKDLNSWLRDRVNDKYEVVNVERTGNKDNAKVTMTLKSQYGFTFHAYSKMEYYDEELFGLFEGYAPTYETDYIQCFLKYHSNDLKDTVKRYKENVKINKDNNYLFTINSYDDIEKAINFGYDISKILGGYDHCSQFNDDCPKVMINIPGYRKYRIISYSEVLENKENYLEDLQYYYIDLVQRQEIDDSTIPSFKNISINQFYLNDSLIEIKLKGQQKLDDFYFYYVSKYNTYLTNIEFYSESQNLVNIMINQLNGSFNRDRTYNIVTYRIGDDRFKIEDANKAVFIANKNGKKIDINFLECLSSSYYCLKNEYLISIDDFAKLVGCDYKVVDNAVYFSYKN